MQQNSKEYYEDLAGSYDKAREILLEIADKLNLDPEYAHENQSGREIPEGFTYYGQSFSIRDSEIFQLLAQGSLDQLKEFIDDPEKISEYLEEIFGTKTERGTETQANTEKEELREAA